MLALKLLPLLPLSLRVGLLGSLPELQARRSYGGEDLDLAVEEGGHVHSGDDVEGRDEARHAANANPPAAALATLAAVAGAFLAVLAVFGVVGGEARIRSLHADKLFVLVDAPFPVALVVFRQVAAGRRHLLPLVEAATSVAKSNRVVRSEATS